MYSRIIGTGRYLPKRVLTNYELSKSVNTTEEWIETRSGIKARHIAEEGEVASDLAEKASLKALEAAGVRPEEIDLVIVATTTPDMIFPSTACILQAKLGISTCTAFDVQAVCSGFVYALTTADLFIKAGKAKNALVVGSEVYSKILNWEDRSTCVLFGDGSGAVVLTSSKQPGILASKIQADGRHTNDLCVPGWVKNGKTDGYPFVQMDGPSVFKFAVNAFEKISKEVVEEAEKSMADVDWFIPHQANIRIMKATAKKLGIKQNKLVATVDHHGNTSAASIPMAMDEYVTNGNIKKNQCLLLVGVGGGYTWGGIILVF